MSNLLDSFLRNKISGLDEEELANFSDLWIINRRLKKNEILKSAGLVETNIYFIEHGAVKICYQIDEQEIIVEFGFTNSCIFDLVSYFSGEPSHFYIQAIKSTKIIGISKADFNLALSHSTALNNFWIKNIENLLLNSVDREIDILSNSPVTRYKRLVQRKPHLFQNIPNKYIALYLGMSPETLSRLKKS